MKGCKPSLRWAELSYGRRRTSRPRRSASSGASVDVRGQHRAPAVVLGARDAAPSCSHDTIRPCRSTVWPLVFIAGSRNTETEPSVSSPAQDAIVRNVGPDQIPPRREPRRPLGPSAARVQFSRCTLAKTSGRKRGSMTSTLGGEIDSHGVFVDTVETPLRNHASRVKHLVFIGWDEWGFVMNVPCLDQYLGKLTARFYQKGSRAHGRVADF